jgi:hypothetical protein
MAHELPLKLGKPMKRRAATATHPARRWFPVMGMDTKVTYSAWAQFIAVSGLEEVAPNIFRDATAMEYRLERRSEERA